MIPRVQQVLRQTRERVPRGNSAILYGSALSDGNAHSNFDLPLLVAGHAGGLRGGQHVAAEPKTPVANLFVQMLNCAGAETESFADSTGQLDLRA